MGALFKFFVLTYTVAWTCFLGASAISPPSEISLQSFLVHALYLFGTISPSLVAIGLTANEKGRSGVTVLLNPILNWNVGFRWYAFAVSYISAIKIAAAVLHRVIVGEWPRFGNEAWYIMAAAIFFSMWVQAGEEIGWRGFALPRLAEKLGLPVASIVLGIIWALWHLPFFFIPEADTFNQSLPVYILQVTALSVAMAWLYWRTSSLFLVMILHAAVNNTKDIVPSAVENATDPFALSKSLVAWLTVMLLWTAAAYFLFRMRGAKLELGNGSD